MTKVAIKNENITSFGGIYIISLWLFILVETLLRGRSGGHAGTIPTVSFEMEWVGRVNCAPEYRCPRRPSRV